MRAMSVGRLVAVAMMALLGVLLLMWGGSSGVVRPAPVAAAEAEVAGELWEALAQAPDDKVRVLVLLRGTPDLKGLAAIEDWEKRGWAVYEALRTTAERSQPAVLQRLAPARAAGRAEVIRSFWIVNVISMRVDSATLRDLAAMPEVEAIVPHAKLETPVVRLATRAESAPDAPGWNVAKIRAPEVWASYANGTGVVVANVDTGVDYTHPALVGHYRGTVAQGVYEHNYNWFDPTGTRLFPAAVLGNSHGTHVMGTEVGDDGAGNAIGVAPGARWIAAFGCCPDNETLLAAMEWIVAPTDLAGNNPDPSKRPDVVNHSWGGPGGSMIFERLIAAARASGIFQSYSSGNPGSGCGQLGSPGDNPSAFNVGATDVNDSIANFSGRGPNPFTGAVGPALTAPGSGIRSSVLNGGYGTLSGTSMAAPHVAGAAALLISAEPKLRGQVEQLEMVLQRTALPLTTTQRCGEVAGSQIPNNTYGWGRLDVKAAADMVWQAGWLTGQVTSAGQPVAGATVTFTRLGKTLTVRSDEAGRFRVVAGAGSWTMTASASGYQSSNAAVTVSQNESVTQNFQLLPLARGVVSGVVRDAGTNLGIPAMVLPADPESKPVMAGPDGRYTVELPVGQQTLRFEHPGYTPISTTLSLASTGATRDVTLTDRPNYICRDNREPGGPTFNWLDATGGTVHNLTDDGSAAITLPEPFTYFGTSYTTLRVSANGLIVFGSTSVGGAHIVIPFEGPPNNDAAALAEDLNPASGSQGRIYTQTIGRTFVISWVGVEHWEAGNPETFQIVLDLDTDALTYQYQVVSWPDFTGVGLEDQTGSAGQLYSYANSAQLTSGRAVRFTPARGRDVNWGCDHALTMTASANQRIVSMGDPMTYTVRWNNVGFGPAISTTLTATLPANSVFVSAAGGITPSGNQLRWTLGNLRPKAMDDLWFSVIPTGPTTTTLAVLLADASGERREVTTATSVMVCYDLNRSGLVDVADLVDIASRWHQTPATPNFGYRYDVVSDGRIDIQDITRLAAHFGETMRCPSP